MLGETISRYRVLEKLGEGGMGVVYKAEDTKLERTVALKFLAAHLLNDGEAKHRFLREAKAAAALNHPNLCPVYEIDEVEGRTFLAMAFLKGETLEGRIAKGPLPLKDALDIGRQVAEGLEAAHVEGIVHRDIKPANVLVSAEGRTTIMDFGLARLTEASKLTRPDQTVGTAAYMSPEQIQGGEVDHRTDVWALGCVLFEMVAGVRPFKGQYDQALLYEIVQQEPEPLTGLRIGVPIELELVVLKCLAKDRENRYQSAKEIAVDLRSLADKLRSGHSAIRWAETDPLAVATAPKPVSTLPRGTVVLQRSRLSIERMLTAALGIGLLAVLTFYLVGSRPGAPEKLVTRFSFAPEGLRDVRVSHEVAISPDGRHILYTAETEGKSSLWVRPLGSESARELVGTQGAREGFWAPDSSSIGFATDAELRRVSLDGGEPITLCTLAESGELGFAGGTWSPDLERIVYSSGLRLYEIAARGGRPRMIFDLKGHERASSLYPHFLSAGGGPPALIFSAAAGPTDRWVAVLNLETGERRELGPGSGPVYHDGHLVYGDADDAGGGLWAMPFSRETLEPTGDAFPISATGKAPTLSLNGTLSYMEGENTASVRMLVWYNRSGERPEIVGQPQPLLFWPSISPDGRRVAVRSIEGGVYSIWIHDLARSTKARLTFNNLTASSPAWSPSGLEIAYHSNDTGGSRGFKRKVVDGTADAVLLADTYGARPDWSHDGRHLVYQSASDIFYLEIPSDDGPAAPKPFLDTAAREGEPRLSPDSSFLAYVSDESGRDEVYLSTFPAAEQKLLCSKDGGALPRWRGDGSELYYVEGSKLMAVPVSTTGQTVTLGRANSLFEFPERTSPGFGYDVSEDGKRFLLVATDEDAVPVQTKIRIVENWSEELSDSK